MGRKILIAFYSRTGNTERIAGMIHQQIVGTLHRIAPASPYPKAYRETVDQAKKEIKRGFHPPLRDELPSVKVFDLLLIGSPNWWSTVAPPVASFLSAHDFAGKSLAPFCTHGGGGLGNIKQDIIRLCPHADILGSFEIYESGGERAQNEVRSWLSRLGVI
jgi:flavodoxin